jgi:hypothetical protein
MWNTGKAKYTAELRDRPPALKGLPPGLELLGGGAWPGGEIGKFNHSIANSLNHSVKGSATSEQR